MYDFDAVIDRKNSDSEKWFRYRDKSIIPMWVADMDFASPPAVIEALHERVAHGVFGYARPDPELKQAVIDHLQKRFGWAVASEWVVWLPGLVTGLNLACRSVGDPGSGVVTMVPTYPPFLTAPAFSDRRLETMPMHFSDDEWRFDPDRLRRVVDDSIALFMLCNPHNPTGRVFPRMELEAVADICLKAGSIICSDEIHCDLVLQPGCRHIPMASMSPEIADRTITLMAPSKTFNLPGLGCSFAVISNEHLRRRFKASMAGIVPHVNAMGLTAAQAAYMHGQAWLDALLQYLRTNRDIVSSAIQETGRLRMGQVQATYLAWIDVQEAGIAEPTQFFEQAGVGVSDGAAFGAPGFVRLNFGCPRSLLTDALDRMRKALKTC
jgi:cysteine-S-conjugate beta-lyase